MPVCEGTMVQDSQLHLQQSQVSQHGFQQNLRGKLEPNLPIILKSPQCDQTCKGGQQSGLFQREECFPNYFSFMLVMDNTSPMKWH